MLFRLRIPPSRLRSYWARYDLTANLKLEHLRNVSENPGYITTKQLYEVCRWKSPRRPELAKTNPEELVREVTNFAFHAKHEELRIGALTLLNGVSFPTASVILHFCVDNSYPILDFRALWSLGIKRPPRYTVAFWCQYVRLCRGLAAKHGMSVRELDMALWQFSRDNQLA
jgi:hypothetical protein